MNDESTRPATFADVKLLISALNEAGAEYFLIGGDMRCLRMDITVRLKILPS